MEGETTITTLQLSILMGLQDIAEEAVAEAHSAAVKWKPFNSAHEGFAVMAEEVDELAEAAGLDAIFMRVNKLWEHVKVNQKRRDLPEMRKECVQVAAMAIRFIHDVIDGGRGRV